MIVAMCHEGRRVDGVRDLGRVHQRTVIPCAVSRVMPGAVSQASSADVTAQTILSLLHILRLYDKESLSVESDKNTEYS